MVKDVAQSCKARQEKENNMFPLRLASWREYVGDGLALPNNGRSEQRPYKSVIKGRTRNKRDYNFYY